MSVASLHIVIVAFNSGAWLARAVAQALPNCAQLTVVDNASTDGSVAALLTDARLKILRNELNLGFARAANLGFHASALPYVLFLNPDCALGQTDVSALISTLQAMPQCGALSVQLCNTDGSAQAASLRADPTPWRAIAEASGLSRWRPGLGIHLAPPDPPGLLRVDACSGAFMLMPADVVRQLAGFDEGYFLHCEDLDLCRRVRQAGLQVWVDTRARVLHDKGTSSQSEPALVARAKYAGMLRYFAKFDAAHTAWPLRGLLYAGAWLRLQYSLLRRH